ncbi:MAG: hypothetical protein KatS3mg105_3563 [Gemmatales bacterium]|nr:MAG: hypothetical protein KatS3mg105_3563 [Gemmatales bacterium]
MPGPAAIIREIHRLKKHIVDLRNELDRGPIRLKKHHDRVARLEDMAKEAEDALRKLKVAVQEKELALKSTHQLIEKHKRQLNEAASTKEYEALLAEIENEKKTCQQLEDEIIAGLEEVEVRAAKLPELAAEADKLKQQTPKIQEELQTRRNEITELLSQAHKQLEAVEATLPADFRDQYNRLVKLQNENAFAEVHGRTCSACYTEITMQCYNDLLQEQFRLCESCGRMIYLPQSSRASVEES